MPWFPASRILLATPVSVLCIVSSVSVVADLLQVPLGCLPQQILVLLALAVMFPAVLAGNAYVALPNTDVTVDNDIVPEAQGWRYYRPDGNNFPQDTLISICESVSGCMAFSSPGWTKSFYRNDTVTSFISNTTCGANAGDLTLSAGT